VLLPVWIVAICGLIAAVIAAEASIYQDAGQRAAGAAFGAANIMARVADGPASGTSLGAMSIVESYLVLAIFVALMSGQAVVRHTRLDEETGRAELIGSSVVGRHARLSAALIVAALANAVIALAATLVLVAHGLPLGGSLAAAVSLAGVGLTFASVAAVAAQASVTQRGANGLVGLALGVAFLLRAVGDAFGTVAPNGVELVSSWPSWLSPIGWGQQMRPFYQDNWAIGALFLGFAVFAVGLAYRLSAGRDLGTGLMHERRGRASASPRLLSPWGLAWRLQRAPLLAWIVGTVVMGASFGAVGTSVDDLENVSPQLAEMLQQQFPGAALVDVVAAFMMGFLGVVAAGYTIQALLRMRAEEVSGRLEPVLATSVDRGRWLASHGVIAGLGTVAVIGAMGLAATLGYVAAGGDLAGGLDQTGAALTQLPPALALGAFVLAAFALVPRFAPAIGWSALAISLVVGQLGEMLKLPQAAINLSPFMHMPAVPAEALAITPIALLLAASLAFVAMAVAAFRRRDLAIHA
jgi:ABC-2 type transport system permease protein